MSSVFASQVAKGGYSLGTTDLAFSMLLGRVQVGGKPTFEWRQSKTAASVFSVVDEGKTGKVSMTSVSCAKFQTSGPGMQTTRGVREYNTIQYTL